MTCPNITEPRGCWNVRCQLGKQCITPERDDSRASQPSGAAGEVAHDQVEAAYSAWCHSTHPDPFVRMTQAIRASLASPSSGGWMPIATIPEKGEFLVFMPEERMQIQAAKWHPNVKVIGGNFAFDMSAPTHWMPLPAAPKSSGESHE